MSKAPTNKRTVNTYVRRFLFFVAGFCTVLFIWIQTGVGLDKVLEWGISRFGLKGNASVSIGRVQGNLFHALSVSEIALTKEDESPLLSIDRFRVQYDFLKLITGSLYIEAIELDSTDIQITQEEDGSWDIVTLFSSAEEPDEEEETSNQRPLHIEQINLTRLNVLAHCFSVTGDSTYQLDDFNLIVNDFISDDGIEIYFDRLEGSIFLPHRTDSVALYAKAALKKNLLHVDDLRLQSQQSDLYGSGTLAIPLEDSLLQATNFALKADPLAFDDIRIFAPNLPPYERADIVIALQGQTNALKGNVFVDLSDGASLSSDLEIISLGNQRRQYKVDSDLQAFNPAFLDSQNLPEGLVNLGLDLDIVADSLENLTGTTRAFIGPSLLSSQAIDSTRLDITWNQGAAELDLLSILNGSRITMNGSASPFATILTYDLAGRIDRIDLSQYMDSSFTSSINARWSLDGQGVSVEEAILNAEIDLEPSRINRLYLSSGDIQLGLRDKNIQLESLISTRTGFLDTEATVQLGDQITIDSLKSELSRLSITDLLGDTTNSSISGTLLASATLSTEPSGNWELNLSDTQYGPYLLKRSALSGDLSRNTITLSSANSFEGGALSFEAEILPFGEELEYTITEATYSAIDIGKLTQNPSLATDLSGTLSLKGIGTEPATMDVSGEATLESSRFNNQSINDASLSFSLVTDTLTSALDLNAPEGFFRLRALLFDLSSDVSYSVEQATFRGVDVGSWVGDSSLTSSLHGAMTLSGSGQSLPELQLAASFDLFPSTFNDATIERGNATFDLQRGAGQLRSFFNIGEGQVDLNADVSSQNDLLRYQFRASTTKLAIHELLGQDSLETQINISVTGDGEGIDPRTMQVAGTVQSEDTFYDRIDVDQMTILFDLRDGMLNIDSLHVESNIASIDGSGPIALYNNGGNVNSDFVFQTTLQDLSPLAPFTGSGRLSLFRGMLNSRISGEPGYPRFDSRIEAEGLAFNDLRLNEAEARIIGEIDTEQSALTAAIDGSLETISVPGFVLDEVLFEASFDDQKVSFNVDSRIDNQRDAQIRGVVSLFDDYQTIDLTRLNLKLDEDQWSLSQPTYFRVGTPIEVNNFALTTDTSSPNPDQLIALDGTLDVSGAQDITLQIRSFDIGTVAELTGFQGLDGTVNAFATLQGEATAPTLEGNLNIDLISYDEPAGDLNLEVNYDSLQLNLDAVMDHVSGKKLTVAGYLPVDLTLAPPDESTTGAGISQNLELQGGVNLTIKSDSLEVDWLLPFVDNTVLSRLEGILVADVTLTGTGDNPQLSGSGRIIDGIIRSPLVGVTYRGIESDLTLSENTIYIRSTSTRTGEGRLTIDGEIEFSNLANAELDMDILADEFTAINTREYRSIASGDLKLSGTLLTPELTGDIQLLSTDVYFESSNSSSAELNVQLTEEDLLMLEREFGIRPAASDTSTLDVYNALTMDIDITLERDTWIRSLSNPEMNVQFNGELDLVKQPNEDQAIYGSIEVNPDRSYITQFGKRFDIILGTITFNGPATDPILDFEAQYEVPSRRSQDNAVTVLMDIEGSMESLDLTLRSDPVMELTDIVSYVVTGQPASEALQLGGLASQSAGDIAVSSGVGLLSGAIESLVQGSGLELDVIQIEPQDDARGATITAGKYVTPRLFTAVSQPIGAFDADGTSEDNGTVVTIELELLDSLLLRLLAGESVMQINVLWHYAY